MRRSQQPDDERPRERRPSPNDRQSDRPTGPWDRPIARERPARPERAARPPAETPPPPAEPPARRRWSGPPSGGRTGDRPADRPDGRPDGRWDRPRPDRAGGAPAAPSRPRSASELPDWYSTEPAPERSRGRDGGTRDGRDPREGRDGRGRGGRRRSADERPDVRWDDDLSDPSELAGWRSPHRPEQQAPAARAGRTGPTSWAGPPTAPATGRTAAVPAPAVDPDRTQPHAFDDGWQAPAPPARPRPDARRDPYGPLGPTAAAPAPVIAPEWQQPDLGDTYDDDVAGYDRADDAHDQRARRAPRAAPGPRPELPHVDAFDGLRAVALLAVLAFHQGFEFARGGFLALSSFLTLSGFLVGTTTLAEWAQNGSVGVGRFWARRGRRILPPLVATVAVVVALQVTLRVGAGPWYRGDVLAALGQVLNWRYVFEGDGFARVLTDPSPVQHLWSLSLLVQITVVLPLLFVGLTKVTGARWRVAGGAFALLAAASFAAAWFTAGRSGNGGAAYYGTHTRAGELLVGVVLAYAVLSPRVRRAVSSSTGSKAVRFGTPVALLVLLGLWATTGLYSANLFGGITALNAVLTAWVIFAVTMPGPVSGVLGSMPLRLVGRVSFAAYLVHWPLFLLLDDERLGFSGPLLFLVRLAATLAAGAALGYGIERPVQRLRLPAPKFALGLGLVIVVVAAAAFVLPQQPPRGVSLTVDDGSGPGDLDVVVPSGDQAASVAVVGGSLAGSLTPGFEAWNAEHPDQGVRVATHVAADCPLSGPGPVRLAGEVIGEETSCIGFGPRLPRLLDEADPDVVVVVPGVGDLGDREIDRQWVHAGDPVFDTWLRQHLDDLADRLDDAGVPVVWATSPHVRLAPAGDEGGADWTSVAANDPARVDRLNEIIRQVAADRDDMSVVDLGAWAQRLPRGEFGSGQRSEGRDLTEDGAARAAQWLVPALFDVLGITIEEPAPAPDPAATAPATDPAATDPAATAPVDPAAEPVDPAVTP